MKTKEEIEAMSDEERRIKTAEVCGWTRMEVGLGPEASGKTLFTCGSRLEGTPPADRELPEDDQHCDPVPDYLNSLDAMAEVERWMDDKFRMLSVRNRHRDYLLRLMLVCHPDAEAKLWDNGKFLGTWGDCVWAYTATARQRNTAFLMVMMG